jgi:hypothetical protein
VPDVNNLRSRDLTKGERSPKDFCRWNWVGPPPAAGCGHHTSGASQGTMASLQAGGAFPSAEEKYARLRGVQFRDAIVFLVDWRHSMATEPMASGAPPLAEALTAIVALMRDRIKASHHDLFGVVAFGAGVAGEVMKDSAQTWKGVRVILPLQEASADGIIQLKGLVHRLRRGDARRMLPRDEDPRGDPRFSFGAGPVEMQNCLWAVRYQFMLRKIDNSSSGRTMFNRQRCYVLTNDDNPVGTGGAAGVRTRAVSNAADMSEAGITVEVTFLRCDGGKVFDPSKFYNEIVYVDRDEHEDSGSRVGINTEGITGADELEVSFKGKLVKKRTTARTTLQLEKGLVIGVGLYSTVRKATLPAPVKIKMSTGERLGSKSLRFCEWTGKPLGTEDLRINFDQLPFMASGMAQAAAARNAGNVRAELFGDAGENGCSGNGDRSDDGDDDDEDDKPEKQDVDGDDAIDEVPAVSGFTPAEMKDLGRLGEPDGITLFGFRDVGKLRREDVIKPPSFVYPDESMVKGSTKLFAALLDSMVRAGKMAIALRSSERASSGPRFCALVPQAEVMDDKGMQTTAPGMHLIPLPYKNDIYTGWRAELKTLAKEEAAWEEKVSRSGGALRVDDGGAGGGGGHDGSDDPEVTEKVARKLVVRLRRNHFDSSQYANPAIERYYAALEAASGVESQFEPPDDDLEPDRKAMRMRCIAPIENGREKIDVLAMFKELTVGRGFNASEIALLYGTKTGLKAKETAERRLKRKAEKDAKASAALEELCEDEYTAAAKQGDLGSFTAAKLKVYCIAHSLPVSGSKASIIQRIEDHMNPDDGVI